MANELTKADYLFFINNLRDKSWKDNPELAENLSKMWSPIFLSFRGKVDTIESLGKFLCLELGLGVDDGVYLFRVLDDEWLRHELRCEYDEIYAEAQFMDPEDRGW